VEPVEVRSARIGRNARGLGTVVLPFGHLFRGPSWPADQEGRELGTSHSRKARQGTRKGAEKQGKERRSARAKPREGQSASAPARRGSRHRGNHPRPPAHSRRRHVTLLLRKAFFRKTSTPEDEHARGRRHRGVSSRAVFIMLQKVSLFAVAGALAACAPPLEGLPPPPSAVVRRLPKEPAEVRDTNVAPSASPNGADAPKAATPVSERAENDASEASARQLGLLLEHVVRAVNAGDSSALQEVALASCWPGPCERLGHYARAKRTVVPRPPAVPGFSAQPRANVHAHTQLASVCRGRPCEDVHLLFARDCTRAGHPWRLANAVDDADEAARWLASGRAVCPSGRVQAVAPSPFDPSGTAQPRPLP